MRFESLCENPFIGKSVASLLGEDVVIEDFSGDF